MSSDGGSPTYGVCDLKHRARCCCLVSAHDVLELNVAGIALFGTEDRSANDGRVLVFREVLLKRCQRLESPCYCGLEERAYLACIADLQETGTAVEDLMVCQQGFVGAWVQSIPIGASAMFTEAQRKVQGFKRECGEAQC